MIGGFPLMEGAGTSYYHELYLPMAPTGMLTKRLAERNVARL